MLNLCGNTLLSYYLLRNLRGFQQLLHLEENVCTNRDALLSITLWYLSFFPFFIADYVYFENSSSNPYLIRRIEELNKVPKFRRFLLNLWQQPVHFSKTGNDFHPIKFMLRWSFLGGCVGVFFFIFLRFAVYFVRVSVTEILLCDTL